MPERTGRLPDTIALPGIGETWRVGYRFEPGVSVVARTRGADLLTVSGPVNETRATIQALRRWLSRRTRATIEPQLHGLAAEMGLPSPAKVRVGFPRTRWASCSSKQTISVNARCLFLPEDLVRSILVHELCHLEQLNHSKHFYRLLERCDPDHRDARAALREGWRYVPEWVDGA